jgi:2'-phosphotransferase
MTTELESVVGGLRIEKENDDVSSSSQPPKGTKSNQQRGGRKGGGGGRGNDSPTTQLSKALSYILRHGTLKEGLKVRPDGYVPLDDVLARPKVAKIKLENGNSPSLEDVRKIVDSNDKKRFEMIQKDEIWLIRAVQGHSIANVSMKFILKLSFSQKAKPSSLLIGYRLGSRSDHVG